MRTIVILFAVAMMASSCVSTSAIFHDGKTLGKDSTDGHVAITLNEVPAFITFDDSTKKTEISPSRKMMAPYINMELQSGITRRLDGGFGIGIGSFSAGAHGYLKYSLLPKHTKAGIALLAQASATFVDDLGTGWFEENDLMGVNLLASTFGMPISFPLGRHTTFVLTPMYNIERIRVKDDIESKDRSVRVLTSYRVGTTLILRKQRTPIKLNVTMAYYPDAKVIVPILGFAFTPMGKRK